MKRGFTLIELIVVISIIAILSGIVLPVVGGLIDEARDTRMISEVKTLALACLQYEKKNGFMPYHGLGNGAVTYSYSTTTAHQNQLNNHLAPFLSRRIINDPYGTQYRYHNYHGYTNLKVTVCAAGKDKSFQSWSGTLWQQRSDSVGDDYYMVVK